MTFHVLSEAQQGPYRHLFLSHGPGGCLSGNKRPGALSGFSLVEVVIALGVVAFCLIPMLGLLTVAYNQDRTSNQETGEALVIQSMDAICKGMKYDALTAQLSTGTVQYYFDAGGRYYGTTSTTAAYYRCTIKNNPAVTADLNHCGATLSIQYPAPAYPKTDTYPLSFFRYGAQWSQW